MSKSNANSNEIYLAADTEAQTAFNDKLLSDYINVTLKKQRAKYEHYARWSNLPDAGLALKIKTIENKIKQLRSHLCYKMNTYLLGYCEINRKNIREYHKAVNDNNRQQLQDKWVDRYVKYWFNSNVKQTPWQDFLNEIVFRYGNEIRFGGRSKLIIYFHNLDYDVQNFLQFAVTNRFSSPVTNLELLRNGTIYSCSFQYKKCVIELRDSQKIYNQSLASLGKMVNWHKQTDKATYDWFNLTDPKNKQRLENETYYFRYDIAVLAAVMRYHFKKMPGKAKLTAASYAEKDLKKCVRSDDLLRGTNYFDSLFNPQFTSTQESFIRSGYYGGFVYASRYIVNQKLTNGLVGDVNSLYPSVMLNRNYPDWQSVTRLYEDEFKTLNLNDYNTFAIIRIEITTLQINHDGVPCIPKKSMFGQSKEVYKLSDLGEIHDIVVTNHDLYWIKKNYHIEYRYITGIIAREYLERPFKSFVLRHKKEKEEAKRNHDNARKMIAKIHLNSSYGKFAQAIITTKQIPIVLDDGSIGFTEVKDPNASERQHNILIAVFVTAFARDVLLNMIEILKSERDATFWYCDTDAVHFGYNGKLDIVKDDQAIFKELHIPFDVAEFGKWKPEQHMSRARYLGSKRYWEQDPLEHKAIIKGAGIQKRYGKAYIIKQGFDKFYYGRDNPIIVPFQVSEKTFAGVKIYESVKLIEPTPVLLKSMQEYEFRN